MALGHWSLFRYIRTDTEATKTRKPPRGWVQKPGGSFPPAWPRRPLQDRAACPRLALVANSRPGSLADGRRKYLTRGAQRLKSDEDFPIAKIETVSSNHRRTWLTVLLVAAVGSPSHAAAMALREPLGAERLPDGNTLITDAGNFFGHLDARVFEVDSLGRLVWAYLITRSTK